MSGASCELSITSCIDISTHRFLQEGSNEPSQECTTLPVVVRAREPDAGFVDLRRLTIVRRFLGKLV